MPMASFMSGASVRVARIPWDPWVLIHMASSNSSLPGPCFFNMVSGFFEGLVPELAQGYFQTGFCLSHKASHDSRGGK